MRFSLLIPTRGRRKMLVDFLDSIYESTDYPEGVEVLLKVDDDEVSTNYEFSEEFKKRLNIKIFVETRSPRLANDYYNYMAARAQGDYIWPLNDDCLMIKPALYGWDTIILDKMANLGLQGKIAYLNMGVTGHTDLFSPFPMVSKEVIKCLGYLHSPLINTWDSDVILWNIFNGLKNIYGIDRIIDFRRDIAIRHHNSAGDIGDATQDWMRQNHNKHGGMTAGAFKDHGHYIEPVEKLKEAIDHE